jgi:hypothetical protein
MAVAANKPLLVLKEKGVAERGVLRKGYVHPVLDMPRSATVDWLNSSAFERAFSEWLRDVKQRRHLFLGYSSKARAVADQVSRFITEKLSLTVSDWRDFTPTVMLSDAIREAEQLTTSGIFLFMADDPILVGGRKVDAPRDNVVFEAGFFAGAKGKEHALVIREKNTKLPTDLGGLICLELANRDDISPLHTKLRDHLERVIPDPSTG